MLQFSGSERPWLARLDHLICETSDIERAYSSFLHAGFPSAWPIGRFWPQGRTAGVHLGLVNLEFLQADEGAPEIATIRTLVFEPVDLDGAVAKYFSLGIRMRVVEKWESDPDLLKLRGFRGEECRTPQLICRNAYPEQEVPFEFFLCEYSSGLKERLKTPVDIPSVTRVVLECSQPKAVWHSLDGFLGLPTMGGNVEIAMSEVPGERSQVIQIMSGRGPIDFEGFDAAFRFA